MEEAHKIIERILAAKEVRRQKLAGLSFPEKVKTVVRLQKTVHPLLLARGKNIHIWNIE